MGFASYDLVELVNVTRTLDDTFTPGDGSNIVSGVRRGSLLLLLLVSNSDIAPNVLSLKMVPLPGAVGSNIASIALPARAGYDGTPPIDLLAAMPTGTSLWATVDTGTALMVDLDAAPGTGTTVDVAAVYGNF
jgi:hypothetical protein